jgi:hypothetical protein
MRSTSIKAVVSATDVDGRLHTIRSHCRTGTAVSLRRERGNPHDAWAIAVWVECRSFFGLFTTHRQIGYVRSGWSKKLAQKLDSGELEIRQARITRLQASKGMSAAHIVLEIDCERVGRLRAA